MQKKRMKIISIQFNMLLSKLLFAGYSTHIFKLFETCERENLIYKKKSKANIFI